MVEKVDFNRRTVNVVVHAANGDGEFHDSCP
jgi:hypothetical protein